VIDEPGLAVPHPRLAERRFVLEPLAELDPTLVLPDGRSISALLDRNSSPAGLPSGGTMGSCPASTSSTSTKPSSSSA
jgi:hypothetical protein